jgi:CRP/FNR family transcriptional regulator, anaerobic regulatory protein
MQARIDALFECYPILKSIPRENVDRVLKHAQLLRLKSGAVVFEELQNCNAFPFVLSGAVRVVKRSEAGREISLYTVTPGDACVVSSACLLGSKPYNAVGLVQADCELVMLPAPDFNQLMSLQAFREFIFSLFSKRVLDLMMLIDEVAFRKLASENPRQAQRHPAHHPRDADSLGDVRANRFQALSRN